MHIDIIEAATVTVILGFCTVICLIGVKVRIKRDPTLPPLPTEQSKAVLSTDTIYEALPAIFEVWAMLGGVFGLAFKSTSESTRLIEMVSLLASAGYLSYKGGYGYRESLFFKPPAEQRNG